MTAAHRPSVLQQIAYPRESTCLHGVPFHGLMGWGFGDPEILVARAEVVMAVDVMTQVEVLVYGQVNLFHCEFGGTSVTLRVLAVELDLDSDEIETLATLVEIVKGDHDLPWELDEPRASEDLTP